MMTITFNQILLAILVLAVLILVVYLVILCSKLTDTLKKLDVVLDDADGVMGDVKIVTEIVSDKTQTVNGVIDDVNEVVSGFVAESKQNIGMVKKASAFVGTATTVAGIIKSMNKGEAGEAETDSKKKKSHGRKKTEKK